MKSVLSIAGSDSSGGAGIQADIKTIEALGFYAQAVPTLVTAQNTTGIYGMARIAPRFVAKQIDVVFDDIVPQAVKVGAAGSAENVRAIAKALKRHGARNIVVDPVMVSSSGSALANDDTTLALCRHLFPLAELITPNLPEAEALAGHAINGERALEQTATELLGFGSRWVLIKGGHLRASANDVLAGPGGAIFWFRAPHIETHDSHGTGCTLSSAIACGLAAGHPTWQAARLAKDYVTGAIQAAPGIGLGTGPVDHMWLHATSIEAWKNSCDGGGARA